MSVTMGWLDRVQKYWRGLQAARRLAPARRVALLRRVIVATSFPPFLQLYSGLYRLALWLAVRVLRASPAVKAIYLVGGLADGRLVPGISDIDFVVFADVPPGTDTAFMRRYCRLARLFPVLESWPECSEAFAPQTIYEARAKNHYLWAMAGTSYRLLYGEDLLARVRPRVGADLHLGLLAWASLFWDIPIRYLWSVPAPHPDRLLAASIYYRCATTVLQMDLSVDRDAPLESREATLADAERSLVAERDFIRELRKLAEDRFTREEPGLEDRSIGFLIRRVNSLLGKLRTGPFSAAAEGTRASVLHAPDGTLAELYLDPRDEQSIRRAIDLARRTWGSCYRAAYLSSYEQELPLASC
jgi:hypothetical protein